MSASERLICPIAGIAIAHSCSRIPRSAYAPFLNVPDSEMKFFTLTPGLIALLGQTDALRLWEVVRSNRKPSTIDELCALTGRNRSTVQADIDALMEQKLLRRVRASGTRRSTGYATSHQRIVVKFDAHNPDEKAVLNHFIKQLHVEFDGIMNDQAVAAPDPKFQWRYGFMAAEHVSPDDLVELKRRLRSVSEFWNMLGARRGGRQSSTASQSLQCNHAISIRVEPIRGPLLPLPEIWFNTKKRVETVGAQKSASQGQRGLSNRERQAVRALVQGLARKDVANRLGLSVHTVGTMCKRIYAKLGVRSHAELVAKLAGGEI